MTLMEFLNAANGFLLSTGMSQESIKRTATIPSVCASVAQLMTALVTNYPSVEWTPGKAPDGAYRITGRSVRDPSRGVIVSVRPVVRQGEGDTHTVWSPDMSVDWRAGLPSGVLEDAADSLSRVDIHLEMD
jgi:hypothetical protein